MPKVTCTVADCKYWGEGNECHADDILITVSKDATQKSDDKQFDAKSVYFTACETYEQKEDS